MAKKEAGSDIITLRPAQASILLASCLPKGLPLLFTGKPGVGKSDIVRQGARDAKMDIIVMHPVVCDPTDFKGLPWKMDGVDEAKFLPFGELARIFNAKDPLVVFLDDLGQAMPAVQAAAMQLLHSATGDRRINEHVIPDYVTFIAASNRRTDRAGVQGILEPVKSRFASIVEIEPTVEDWTEWAITAGIAPEVIAFIRFKRNLLCAFEATADLTNSPCPRTWAHVSKLLQANLPKSLRLPAFAGAVGQGAAAEFIAFLTIYENAPDIDDIIANPKTAKIPEEPSALFAVASSLAHAATEKNFKAIATYAERLYKNQKGEFATFAVRDSIRKNRNISKTEAFASYCLTEAGTDIIEADKLYRGEAT
jgi:hypothetical protein